MAASLENLPTNDLYYPWILGASGKPSLIRAACNDLPIIAAGGNAPVANSFPELHDVEQIGPSTAGSNTLARPADAILVFDLTSAQSNSVPDWNVSREFPVTFVPSLEFGYLTKSTSVANWARLWTRNGTVMNIWPTPTSTYVDYFRAYYLKAETMADGDAAAVLKLDPRWFDILVNLATAKLLMKMQRFDDAKNMMQAVTAQLQMGVNFITAESHQREIHGGGMLTRQNVYGR